MCAFLSIKKMLKAYRKTKIDYIDLNTTFLLQLDISLMVNFSHFKKVAYDVIYIYILFLILNSYILHILL